MTFMDSFNIDNFNVGGGCFCEYCGKYIYNAAFNMSSHLKNCEKNKYDEKIEIIKSIKKGENVMCDIYDMEQKIMSVWNTSEDLDLFLKAFMDFESPMSEDDIANLILGIKSLHDVRCQDLWNTFNQIIEGETIDFET